MTAQDDSLLRRFAAFCTSPGATGPDSTAFAPLRAAVGGVFLVSGLVKLLFDNQGPGRFAKLGLPAPHQLATFIGTLEIVLGLAIVVGIAARPAAIVLAVNMIAALVTTKLPLLYGPGPEPIAALPKVGILAFAYQARLDLTMLLACAYLAAVGAGRWSLDAWRARGREAPGRVDAVGTPESVRLAR